MAIKAEDIRVVLDILGSDRVTFRGNEVDAIVMLKARLKESLEPVAYNDKTDSQLSG